jgi:(4-(4-[2-(gamma-L-glutamylamino)ethyl]phenoxymethyl)furan-2-yl)methanamine synthase
MNLVNVLGLDIGGANTKAAFLKSQNGTVKEIETLLEYFPIWKDGKDKLPKVLEKLKTKLTGTKTVDGVGITITAELSDAYRTKKGGINHVLDCVCHVFGGVPLFVLDVEANLLSVEKARREPYRVASANWAATGWMVSKLVKDCVVVDVGSTSTSIIPIMDGKIATKGKTDLEKLQNGELVYSGSLRTNVATIVDKIPVKGKMTRVSSELFSQSGDVHLLLGNITEKDYTAETCDGRGKTRNETTSRLARVVCADTDMVTEQEIRGMAKFVYGKQVEQIADGLKQVSDRIKQAKMAVVTGLGREFLARKAAEKVGFNNIIALEELLSVDVAVVSPSVGIALMVAEQLEGEIV